MLDISLILFFTLILFLRVTIQVRDRLGQIERFT